jgi:hypothetical protein
MSRNLLFLTMLLAVPVSFSAAQPARSASGLQKGDEVTAWEPVHVAGPYAGTRTCLVCTYLEAPMLLAFARDLANAEALAKPLERIAEAHDKGRLRVALVVLNTPDDQLIKLAADQKIQYVMLCRPDVESRARNLAAYKIDPAVPNTIMLYEAYIVKESWTALRVANLPALIKATDPYLPKR